VGAADEPEMTDDADSPASRDGERPDAVLAARLLRVYPVTAEPGGTEAMTRGEVLDAIEARIGGQFTALRAAVATDGRDMLDR
jgi:hypothetical protein